MVQSMNQTALIFALLRNEAVLTLSSPDEILVHNESGSDQRVDLSAPLGPTCCTGSSGSCPGKGSGSPKNAVRRAPDTALAVIDGCRIHAETCLILTRESA